MIRRPAVAGRFYPGNKRDLQEELRRCIEKSASPRRVIGVISPHAGYMFSGGCAGKAFGMVEIPETVVILGVDHRRSSGYSFAVDGNECWRTPLGDVKIDGRLRRRLLARSALFRSTSGAGTREHSLEVQVPFIQYLNPQAKILPILISSGDSAALIEAGERLAESIEESGDVLLLASTDMSHFLDADLAEKYDRMAVERIERLDPAGLFDVVRANGISMCGVEPTATMLAAARKLGATESEVVEYTNSGFVSGDKSEVVAYLSMLVH